MTNDCRFCGAPCVCSPGRLCCPDCLHALSDADVIMALRERLGRMTGQRDALRAACEGVLSALDSITLECRAFHHSPRDRHQIDATCPPEEYARAARNVARAAIAKAGGGNA